MQQHSKFLNGNNMRLIKLLIISLLVLGLLVTAISALFPSTVIVSRAIEVSASPAQIEKYVSNLNEWEHWMSDWKGNKSVFKDSTMYIGTQTIKLVTKNDTSVTYHWVATGQRPYDV
jgi:hypothetical protein